MHRDYRPAIQGLRAVAVLMVVAYHAGLPVPGGFTGVDVFFVISGFVIAEMLRREWTSTGSIALGRFFRRRVRRLLPALALVVVVTLLLHSFIVAPLDQPARTALTGIAGLLLSSNVVIAITTGDYFDAPAETNPLLHLWSLSVEEQFYLVLPVILLLAWRRSQGSSRRGPLASVIFLGFVSIGLLGFAPRILATTAAPDALFGFYSPVVRAWEFLIGVSLALTVRWRNVGILAQRAIGAVGVVFLLGAMLLIDETFAFPGPSTLLPVVGAALLIVATESRRGWLHDALTAGPMVALGDRSYSLYLWHWPIIVLATLIFGSASETIAVGLIAALVSLVPTLWTFRRIEQPIRLLRSDLSLRPILFGSLALPLVFTGFVAVGSVNAWWSPSLDDAKNQLETRPLSRQAGCHAFLAEYGHERFDECWFGPRVEASPIVLIGDSNAAVASDPVVRAGKALGRPVFVSTGSDCPPFVVDTTWRSTACQDLVDATYRWLETQPESDVLLVATDYPWHRDDGAVPDTEGFTAALRATVSTLQSAGHRPILVAPIPAFIGLHQGNSRRIWRMSSCSSLSFFRGACGETFNITPEWPQQPLWLATAAVAAETGAVLIDLTDHICPDGECRTDRGNRWDYRDGTHLSVRRSADLYAVYMHALRG